MKVSTIKKIALVAIVFVLLLCGAYIARKAYNKIINMEQRNNTSIALVRETMEMQQECSLDSLPHNVLCIGNSITLHQPLDKVNWYSRNGMVASKPEFDYCHVLESKLKKLNNKSSVTPVDVASWERDFNASLDSLLHDVIQDKDIIVIRLGENVDGDNINKFSKELPRLIEYCQQYSKHIVITGLYWSHLQKEMAIVENAKNFKLKYVPIDWIWDLYKKECSPKEGDTLYDTNGKQYQIKGNFITKHPNDKGMEMIADCIYNAL